MSWTDVVEDRWGRLGAVRLIGRLAGLGALGYALWATGAFAGRLWVAVGAALALVLTAILLAIRNWRPFDRTAVVLAIAVVVLGIALNPAIDYLGTVFFVLGGVVVVGQPEVPVRWGAGILAVLSVALVLRAVFAQPEWSVLLSNLLGALAVALFGANRRQQLLRQRVSARVTALEERSRIARDLHDLLAHSLGGLVVQLDAASAELDSGRTADAATRIRASRQLAVDGLREARAAVAELRSGADSTPDGRPVDVVEAVLTVLRGTVGLQLGAELEVVGKPRPVQARVAEALTAVAREGLTNVTKHARGERVGATLLFGPTTVRLEIVNGLRGDLAGVDDLARSGGGAGLPGLRERVAHVGGRLDAGAEGRRWVLAAECPERVRGGVR